MSRSKVHLATKPHGAVLAPWAFWLLLALGILDRLYLLWVFGFQYVGDDDAIIWSAAIDYAHGLFREPYFYGQDYAVMLEALVAAPFTWLGVPLHILMPTVTSFLALVPFWSFAFWHRKHGRSESALLFLAMPVLLPVEYGLMTTITRCFISGIAPLALLPWLLDLRSPQARAALLAMVAALAGFISPNSIFFSLPFLTVYFLQEQGRLKQVPWMIIGSLPFVGAHALAQAYCHAHPERMLNSMGAGRLIFNPDLMLKGLAHLDLHLAWLFPVAWSIGSLAFVGLALLLLFHLFKGHRAHAASLALALALIIYAVGLPKTHDGMENVFFPYSRMFLALPLLLCWALAGSKPKFGTRMAVGLLALAAFTVTWKMSITPARLSDQLAAPYLPVSELRYDQTSQDAAQLNDLCHAHGVALIVGSKQHQGLITAQFRCFLYPVLKPQLPPTYLHGYERRFWQKETVADSVFANILLLGTDLAPPGADWDGGGQWTRLMLNTGEPLLLVTENTLPTDNLLERFFQQTP